MPSGVTNPDVELDFLCGWERERGSAVESVSFSHATSFDIHIYFF